MNQRLVAGVFVVGLYPQPVFDVVEQGTVAMMAASDTAGDGGGAAVGCRRQAGAGGVYYWAVI